MKKNCKKSHSRVSGQTWHLKATYEFSGSCGARYLNGLLGFARPPGLKFVKCRLSILSEFTNVHFWKGSFLSEFVKCSLSDLTELTYVKFGIGNFCRS